jgi:hypothetical protein
MSKLRWVALAALLLVAAAGWLGYRGIQAKNNLDTARMQLTKAKDALADRDIPAADAAITKAGQATRQARAQTSDPVWWLAGSVPYLGNTIMTSHGVAVGADDTALRVLPDALAAARLLDPYRLRKPGGVVDVALVRQAAPLLTRSAQRSEQVRRKVRGLPTSLLVGTVARARADLATKADDLAKALDAAAKATDIAPALLGADKPRRFFVLLQQTGESRGTGGIPGGYAILHAVNGKILVEEQGSNAGLRGRNITPPPGLPADFVQRYGQLGTFALWPNVNLSPDLPVVARLVAARWRAQGGAPIDGVVTMDAIALADLLRGSPPVDVGGGRTVTPAGLPRYLAIDQYVGVVERESNAARKEHLSHIASVAIRRIVHGEGDATEMLRGVVDAVQSGHLRMASDDPKIGPTLHRVGVDGALPAGNAPLAYPVVFKTTGGKLDTFLDRKIEYVAGSCSGRTRSSTITLTLRSTPPPDLPPYVTIRNINGKQLSSRTNELAVEIYATRGAKLTAATLDDMPLGTDAGANGPHLEAATEAGIPLWTTFVELPPGQNRRITLQLTEPTAEGGARVPEQPLARPLHRTIAVAPCKG